MHFSTPVAGDDRDGAASGVFFSQKKHPANLQKSQKPPTHAQERIGKIAPLLHPQVQRGRKTKGAFQSHQAEKLENASTRERSRDGTIPFHSRQTAISNRYIPSHPLGAVAAAGTGAGGAAELAGIG